MITKEETYKDDFNNDIVISADSKGYNIKWSDGRNTYKRRSSSTENNFNGAYFKTICVVDTLTKVNNNNKNENFDLY